MASGRLATSGDSQLTQTGRVWTFRTMLEDRSAVGERVVECMGRTETAWFESVLECVGYRLQNIFGVDLIALFESILCETVKSIYQFHIDTGFYDCINIIDWRRTWAALFAVHSILDTSPVVLRFKVITCNHTLYFCLTEPLRASLVSLRLASNLIIIFYALTNSHAHPAY